LEDSKEDIFVTTVCEHTFHKGCLDLWLKEKNTCPICRRGPLLAATSAPAPVATSAPAPAATSAPVATSAPAATTMTLVFATITLISFIIACVAATILFLSLVREKEKYFWLPFLVPCVFAVCAVFAPRIVRFYDNAIAFVRGLDRPTVAKIVWVLILVASYVGLILCVAKYAWAGFVFLPVPALASIFGYYLEDIVRLSLNEILIHVAVFLLSGWCYTFALTIAGSLSLVIWTFVSNPVFMGILVMFAAFVLCVGFYKIGIHYIDSLIEHLLAKLNQVRPFSGEENA
jgi:hypothetical protein